LSSGQVDAVLRRITGPLPGPATAELKIGTRKSTEDFPTNDLPNELQQAAKVGPDSLGFAAVAPAVLADSSLISVVAVVQQVL
jgi:hypothetical protein